MKTRNLIQDAIALTVFSMATLAGLTACTDNDDNPSINPTPSEVVQEGARDIMNGRLFKVISIDTLDRCRLAVTALSNVDVKATTPSTSFAAQITEIDGQRYVTLTQTQAMTNGAELVNLEVMPKGAPEHARNVLLVFRDPSKPVVDDDGEILFEAKAATTRAATAGVPTSVYSQILGHGTNCFDPVGNRQSTIFLFDKFSQLGQNYFEVYEQAGSGQSFQITQSDYTSTMEDWTAAMGLNFKFTRTKLIDITNLGSGPLGFLSRKRKVVWQGSVNANVAGSTKNVNDYEYLMSVYQVKKGDARINMDKFNFIDNSPTAKKWASLISILDEDFIDEACYTDSTQFDPKQFFDEWGTDIITQGTFGGHYTYLYARKHGIYASSIDVDVKTNLKRTTPNWMNALTGSAPDGWSIDAEATYARDDYQELSGSWESVTYEGGGDSFESPEKWAQGFNDTKNWRLISYRMATDNGFAADGYDYEDDETDYTYPVEKLVLNLIAGWVKMKEKNGETLTPADLAAVQNAAACANRLVEGRDAYVVSHGQVSDEAGSLLLADLKVVEGDSHSKDFTGPLVMTDLKGKKRIYYPIMANKYFYVDGQTGYPLDFFQGPLQVSSSSVESKPRYIYYALDTEGSTEGLVDVRFGGGDNTHLGKLSDSTKKDLEDNNYYSNDETELSSQIYNIYVRQYDAAIHQPDDRITACAILWMHNKTFGNEASSYWATYIHPEYKVIGSTGGTELGPTPLASEESAWEAFWDVASYTESTWPAYGYWGNIYGYNLVVHPMGGFTRRDALILIPSRKPLYVSSLENITQPKGWNE